jgi:hypothetical protein
METLRELIERGVINEDPRMPAYFTENTMKKPKRQPRHSLMFRTAKAQQAQLRKVMKALHLAVAIINYKEPEVYEYTDQIDDMKKRFAKACAKLGVK